MADVFAPGCALKMYKPHLADRLLQYLNKRDQVVAEHFTCCRHEPRLPHGTRVINGCAGCNRRYRELYEGVTTISLWELLAESDFTFPDYHGMAMAIHDACPTRTETRVHEAVRTLLRRMNITAVEPEHTGTRATCCGDSFYGVLPIDQVKAQMAKRAQEMPVEDVAVYCVSCIKAMHIGGKKPRYLVDLLFGEPTEIGTWETDDWHRELQEYINRH